MSSELHAVESGPRPGERSVGITSTVPVEIIYAAGLVPVDLNNLFITAPDPQELVSAAQREGIPRTCCSWIKGMRTVALRWGIGRVIALRHGDCSEGETLAELLALSGVEVVPFAYPPGRDRETLRREMEEMASELGATWRQVEEAAERLERPRRLARRLDELTWREDKVSGGENHLTLVSCSDFEGDPEAFAGRLESRLVELEDASPRPVRLRLALVGVPPIFADLYSFLEERGARVVFNEVQRQFSLPGEGDLVHRYLSYTYPYGIRARLFDIVQEIGRRQARGIIHYVQSFCHHQLETKFIADLGLPVLTLEGDRPGPLDARARLRLEAFIELLEAG